MKDIEAKSELQARRPNRGSLRASDREIDQDFDLLGVPLNQRSLIQKAFNKKPKKTDKLLRRWKKQLNREMEDLEAVLGFASFLVKGEVCVAEKDTVVKKLDLGRCATHVAIAQYIKYQQLQPSTPSTTS